MSFIQIVFALTGGAFVGMLLKLLLARAHTTKVNLAIFVQAALVSIIWMVLLVVGVQKLIPDRNTFFMTGIVINALATVALAFITFNIQNRK